MPPAPGEDAWFDKRLADDRIGNEPLYLMMAGVHAARHGATAALAMDWLELAGEMASIETARLERFARSRHYTDDGAILKHLAACVTLQNGCNFASLAALVEEETEALKLRPPFSAEAIAGHLCDCLPSSGDSIEPVRPDLIGESFLLPIVNGDRFRSEAARRDIVLRAYRRAGPGTVDTLVRCARDLADGRADHASVQWLRTIVTISDGFAELVRIVDFMPQATLALREFAVDVTARIVSVLQGESEQNADDINPLLAWAFTHAAIRLSALGRREDALAAAEEAVRLYRALAAARPDAFTPNLATSLSVFADRLEALDRTTDAVPFDEEAVRLLRPYFLQRPAAFGREILTYARDYVRRAGLVGREPDMTLLAPIAEALQRLNVSRSDTDSGIAQQAD
jgi:hypothetical protein